MQNKQQEKSDIFTWIIIALLSVISAIFSFFEVLYTKILISEGYEFLDTPFVRNSHVFLISVIMIAVLFCCVGVFIYISKKINRNIGILAITSLIFASVFIHSEFKRTKEDILLRGVTQLQSSAIEKSYGFEKSDVNNEISAIIQEKDYEKLKTLFTKENINGLSKDEIFEKIIIVKNINDNKIHKAFDKIYADRFISIKEYSDFKSFVIEQLSNNTEYKSSDVNNMKAASLL